MLKKELRKIYKQKRLSLSCSEIEEFQKHIYQKVFEMDFSKFQNIHIFLPIEKQKEINTYPIIDFLRDKKKQIVISKSDFKTNTLEHFKFNANTILEVNKYGIPEPLFADKVKESSIDLVFVPLLISDKKNYRVGYGKGFYDRFLASCREDVFTIGLNFFKPIPSIEDVNEFDVKLNTVIYNDSK